MPKPTVEQPMVEGILGETVDILNMAAGLLQAIAGLAEDIVANNLGGEDACHRAEGIIALAEEATGVAERGLGKLQGGPRHD